MTMSTDEKFRDLTGADAQSTARITGRRGFLKTAAAALSTPVGAFLALPFLKTLVTPATMQSSKFSLVGDLVGFPVGQPVRAGAWSRRSGPRSGEDTGQGPG